MNVLVITYWSYNEPLIQAYTLPYLRIMADLPNAEVQVHLFTLEKKDRPMSVADRAQQSHDADRYRMRHFSRRYHRFGLRAMIAWMVNLVVIWRYCRKHRIEVLHAFGSPAGTSAHFLSKIMGVPYIVDSYEPHAESMVENGSWQRSSLAYKLLMFFERLQTRHAKAVLATTEAMREYAAKTYKHVPRVLLPRPACVDTTLFDASRVARIHRHDIGFADEDVVCVYAGKLGGIYLKEAVFDFFHACTEHWGERFRVIMLSDSKPEEVNRLAEAAQLDPSMIYLRQVPHSEVVDYLALADFGINPVKPVPSKRYCTSIKDGEYWAMGLPVVIPANISDDSALIARERIGAVIESLSAEGYQAAIANLAKLLDAMHADAAVAKQEKARIRQLAQTHRGMALAQEVYARIYGTNGLFSQTPKRFLVVIYNSYRDPLFQNLVLRYILRQAENNLHYTFELITFEQAKYALPAQERAEEGLRLMGKGIYWHPATYHTGRFMLLKKVYDFSNAVVKALRIGLFRKVNLVIAFANTSAAISWVLSRLIRAKLLVYSFEPHSEFMVEFGTWPRGGWQYRVLRFFETKVARMGDYLLTGTRHMVADLEDVAQGEVFWAPSGVDETLFTFNADDRKRLRKQLEVEDRKVLIYAGKFGGIYYNDEIASFCSALHALDARWYFVFITPSVHDEVNAICEKHRLSTEHYYLDEAFSPQEVASWLSMADIGLTAIPPHPNQKYRSPVKVGEYLLCGLPYITCRGVSEDDEWAERYNVGLVVDAIDRETALEAHEKAQPFLNEPAETLRARCRNAGVRYRGRGNVDRVLDEVLSARSV